MQLYGYFGDCGWTVIKLKYVANILSTPLISVRMARRCSSNWKHSTGTSLSAATQHINRSTQHINHTVHTVQYCIEYNNNRKWSAILKSIVFCGLFYVTPHTKSQPPQLWLTSQRHFRYYLYNAGLWVLSNPTINSILIHWHSNRSTVT